MMVKVGCPNCGSESSFSLTQPSYVGPYRCWKCRALYTIRLENSQLMSCEPLSEEEFTRQQEEAKKAKARGY